jgi:two-component system sensor histidine kinase ResE
MKTPLTSIQGFAQALVDGTARDEAGRRQAGRVIHEEAERLRRLVDDLLDLARLDAGQIEFERRPVDVAAILEAVLERQSVLAGKKSLHLIKRIGHPPTLIGDGDRLAQVFTNLIGNAIEHTPPGGEVGLVCEHEDGWVRVHVDDNGPGIPDDELNRIFERFYQVDKARQRGGGHGAGLGLAISNEIVRAHGGRLKAQSVVGRGSRFSVELPVVRSDDDTLVRVSPTA